MKYIPGFCAHSVGFRVSYVLVLLVLAWEAPALHAGTPFYSAQQLAGAVVGAFSPGGIAVADLGNGHPDLVATNKSASAVDIFPGNGDGTFQPMQTLPTPTGAVPMAVAVADLGNGHPDIVVTNSNNNTVGVFLGNGDGTTFQSEHFYAVGNLPSAVAVADLGNGHPDLVVANTNSGTVSVLLGNGDGTFQAQKTYSVGGTLGTGQPGTTWSSSPTSLAVADLGNGHPDLVVASVGDKGVVYVLLGNGDGTFQPGKTYPVTPNPSAVAVADLGNGHPDIVVTDAFANTVSVLLGNGDGTFQQQSEHVYAVGNGPSAVAVADLGNGHPDLVVANTTSGTVSVLLGNGDGTFQAQQFYRVGIYPSAIAVADLGNGHPDIVTADSGTGTSSGVFGTITVLIGNGDGTFQATKSFPGDSNLVMSMTIADLGNSHPDLVTTSNASPANNFTSNPTGVSNGTVNVYLGNGDGTFQPMTVYPAGDRTVDAVVADLGNGHPDIVAVNAGAYNSETGPLLPDGSVSVFLGNGDGTFQSQTQYAMGNDSPMGVAVADLGNGHPDIVTTDWNTDNVSVFLGKGNGTFQVPMDYAVGSDPYGIAVADLGNGHPDIVTVNDAVTTPYSTVSVLLGNGNGTFQPQQVYPVGHFALSVAVADLGNGHPDIVETNGGDNTVGVLLGNGDGTFQPMRTYPVVPGTDMVQVVDVNGDGHPDLVVGSASSPSVGVLLGNGDGTFQPEQLYRAGYSTMNVGVGDLTGDGWPDLVMSEYCQLPGLPGKQNTTNVKCVQPTGAAIPGTGGTNLNVTLHLNPPPTILSTSFSLPENGVLSGTLKDSEPFGLPVNYRVLGPPAHGMLELQSSGKFTYTPATGYVGADRFQVQAANGHANASTAVNITVNPFTVVAVSPPLATLTASPASGTAPLAVTLDASGSSDPNSGGKITQYTFNFGDGTAAVTQSTPSVSHSYATAGSYTASVTVSDNQGHTAVARASVGVTAPRQNLPSGSPGGGGFDLFSLTALLGLGAYRGGRRGP